MKALRILLVLPSSPLPFGNADARWYYVLLKELVERGHNVTAFVACANSEEIAKTQALFPAPTYDVLCYLYSTVRGLLSKLKTIQQPYSYIFSSQLRQDLAKELAKPYDVLHLEQLWSGWLGLSNTQRSIINIHYLFSVDCVFQVPNSLEDRLRRIMTYSAEKRLLRTFPKFITLSDRLTDCVRQINPQANIYTVPMALDLSLYPFDDGKVINEYPTVGIIGNFNWAPSYSAGERLLTKLWPEIKHRVPNARLLIVGRSARDRFATYAALPDVKIYQDVPEIFPYFAKIDILLYAPLAGSGMKVKIMEAFALGTLVVTTSEGVEGIPAEDGIHAGICDDDQGLVERTMELLNNSVLQKNQRLKARQLIESHCSQQVTVRQIEQVYCEVIK